MSDAASNQASPDGAVLDIRILHGSPDDEAVAALTAVVSAALEELAAEANREESTVNAWAQSQRQLRGTLRPGAGAWRGFSA